MIDIKDIKLWSLNDSQFIIILKLAIGIDKEFVVVNSKYVEKIDAMLENNFQIKQSCIQISYILNE
jgi:Co/Zn/Cd efflux system component